MRRSLGIRALWISGVIAFGAQWVYAERTRVDGPEHDRYAENVRRLVALDARLNEQVMQSRQMLVTHYDDLARTVTSMRRVHGELREPPRFLLPEDATVVSAAVQASSDALSEKVRLVESFKSQNAVFRNSARFFPVAAEELRDKLRETPEHADVAVVANDVLVSVLHFVQLPSATELARSRDAIAALEAAALSADLAKDRDVVVVHARTLIERSSKLAELTNAVLSAPTTVADEKLDAAYGHAVSAAGAGADRRRGFMFATLAAVAALMAAEFVQRYRRTAVVERETAAKLAAANEALLRDKEREAELSNLKTRFVSMTSHEFRTPLAVILSSTELLEAYGERWTPAKRSDHYTRIKGAVGTMRELLDTVLVIGKSDAGKLECKPGPLDLVRFVKDSTDAIASTSIRHEIRTDIQEPLPPAEIDEKLATHVLTNLLSNAVKYSPAGGVVKVSVKAEGRDLVLQVADRGIGITEADQVRLFESFHRGENVGTIAGTGLGLAVVKRAVMAHGGTIAVRSEEGEGTTFIVRLPVFHGPPGESDQRAPTRSPSSPEVDPTVV